MDDDSTPTLEYKLVTPIFAVIYHNKPIRASCEFITEHVQKYHSTTPVFKMDSGSDLSYQKTTFGGAVKGH